MGQHEDRNGSIAFSLLCIYASMTCIASISYGSSMTCIASTSYLATFDLPALVRCLMCLSQSHKLLVGLHSAAWAHAQTAASRVDREEAGGGVWGLGGGEKGEKRGRERKGLWTGCSPVANHNSAVCFVTPEISMPMSRVC